MVIPSVHQDTTPFWIVRALKHLSLKIAKTSWFQNLTFKSPDYLSRQTAIEKYQLNHTLPKGFYLGKRPTNIFICNY